MPQQGFAFGLELRDVYHKAGKWVVENPEVVSLTISYTPIVSVLVRGGKESPTMAAPIVAVHSGELSSVFGVPSSSSPTRGLDELESIFHNSLVWALRTHGLQ